MPRNINSRLNVELNKAAHEAIRYLKQAIRAQYADEKLGFVLAAFGSFLFDKDVAPKGSHEVRTMVLGIRAAAVLASYSAAPDDSLIPEELKRKTARYIREVQNDGQAKR